MTRLDLVERLTRLAAREKREIDLLKLQTDEDKTEIWKVINKRELLLTQLQALIKEFQSK